MNSKKFKKIILNISIVLMIFFLDRISKIYIINFAEIHGEVDISINTFINFILVWNTGIGFGLLSFDDKLVYTLITLLIIFINLLIVYLITKSDGIRVYFFLFVLGGSLGNLFDRLYFSAVPDFIDLNFKGYHWFIFNVADIFISLGVMLLIFYEIFSLKKYEK